MNRVIGRSHDTTGQTHRLACCPLRQCGPRPYGVEQSSCSNTTISSEFAQKNHANIDAHKESLERSWMARTCKTNFYRPRRGRMKNLIEDDIC